MKNRRIQAKLIFHWNQQPNNKMSILKGLNLREIINLPHLTVIHLLIDSIKTVTIAILKNLKYLKRGKKYKPQKLKIKRVKMVVMAGDHHLLYPLLHLIRMERILAQIVRRQLMD